MLKRLALVLFGLLLSLVTLELAMRAAGWVFLRARQGPVASDQDRSGTYRILCLGESTTADTMFMGKESYPAQLEKILNARSTGTRYEVINGGIPATSTDTIVEELPRHLDKLKPDMVVTMMGINDGEQHDPFFEASQRLRVVRLARTLYYVWNPPTQGQSLYGPLPPDLMMAAREFAGQHILAGRFAEAPPILKPMLEQEKWLVLRSRSYAMMALLHWQQDQDAEAEPYYRRYLELERALPRSRTAGNYRRLREILAVRKIAYVAVQYPGRPPDIVEDMVDHDPDVVVVSNEQPFLQLFKERPAAESFRDLFGGIFGHLTPHGNLLLAQNVADGVLRAVGQAGK